jgi:hypothetical protein
MPGAEVQPMRSVRGARLTPKSTCALLGRIFLHSQRGRAAEDNFLSYTLRASMARLMANGEFWFLHW